MAKQNVSVQMNVVPFAAGAEGARDRRNYLRSLRCEIASAVDYAGDYAVNALCITGTNPLQYRGESLTSLIVTLGNVFELQKGAEITVDTWPGSINRDDLYNLRNCGVTRVRFDAASFVQSELEALGRTYSTSAIEVFIRMIQRWITFFPFDITLYCGLPGQTAESFHYSLEQALRLKSTHLTVLPFDDSADASFVSWYPEAVSLITASGFEQYTPHHFARDGFESLWNRLSFSNLPRLGFGAGARSLIDGIRGENTPDPAAYIAAGGSPEGVINRFKPVTQQEIECGNLQDALYNLEEYDLADASPELRERAESLCKRGYLAASSDHRVSLTCEGRANWRAVSAALALSKACE
ncbi:MAG: hypothetical protein GX491_21905 [Chloroflexi bacterium]|nr:hypothetical protein [Chloroflexota bacterium]